MQNFTPTDVGVFFFSKCVKWSTFSILQDFTNTNANALRVEKTHIERIREYTLCPSFVHA